MLAERARRAPSHAGTATCADDPASRPTAWRSAQALAAAGETPARAGAARRAWRVDGDVTEPMRAQACRPGRRRSTSSARRLSRQRRGGAERRVLALAPDEADRRLAYSRSCARWPAPARAQTLGRALLGDRAPASARDPVLIFFLLSEFARLFPRDRLGPYLVGRQLLAARCRACPALPGRACEDEDAAPAQRRSPRCRPTSCASAGA